MRERFTRNEAAALAKVCGEWQKKLHRAVDELIVEYLAMGGPLTGSPWAKEVMLAASKGGDLSKLVASMVKWLDDKERSK